MAGCSIARGTHGSIRVTLMAALVMPLAAAAQTLSITPLAAVLDTSLQIDSGTILDSSIKSLSDEPAQYSNDYQWSSANAHTGAFKYINHVNTSVGGVPSLEARGDVYASTTAGMAYRFSNEGTTTLTLPAGSIRITLSSSSGAYRLPSTQNVPDGAYATQEQNDVISFGFGKETKNVDMDEFVRSWVAGELDLSITHMALAHINDLRKYSGAEQGWIQDEVLFAENKYPFGDDFIPIGEQTVVSFERGVSLEMLLTNDQPIEISPGTSRPFFVLAGSSVRMLTAADASESNFPYVFKDGSHSADLSLQLPAGITLVGAPLSWVATVPEPNAPAAVLAGLLVLSAGTRCVKPSRIKPH